MSNTPKVTAVIGETPYAVTLSDELGHSWLGDEPPESGGANRGPTPHHLLLGSLGACTAITVSMYARRKSWPLEGLRVELGFEPDPAPGVSDIRRRVTLLGELSAGQRERLLEIANKCPIHKVLTGQVRIDTSLT
jgi:putative redox protein